MFKKMYLLLFNRVTEAIKALEHSDTRSARTILIRPFDPSLIRPMTKSIQASDLGLTPNDDGKAIRLMLPPLTVSMPL